MASRPEKSQLVTASDVQWSDGTSFQGSLLMVLVLPSLAGFTYSKAHLKGTDVHEWRIPTRVKVPIIDGEMSSSTRVWQNAEIEPPETVWCGFWYDETGNNIAVDNPALVNVNTDPFTITPPALTVPTAAASHPGESTLGYGTTSALLIAASTLIIEVASGSGASITVSNTPIQLISVFVNGNLMKLGTDYTISGATITFTFITVSAGEVQVLYYA